MLERAQAGDPGAAAALLEAVYGELRALAQHHLARERPGHTLQATALVHEAYLRLVRAPQGTFTGRAHFLAAAAQAMRRILVDHARTKGRQKRGGGPGREGAGRLSLDVVADVGEAPSEDIVALSDSLDALGREDPDAARIVEMRFFAGMEVGQIAAVLGVTERTVHRHWTFARAWLFRALGASSLEDAP
jgi:RNA polymerase sigma factor (TIGR02999 family)